MGKGRFEESTEFLERHFKKGDEVGIVRLTSLIMKEIGSDDRTIQGYLETMIRTKLIEDIGNCHFRITHGI